jgi:3-deoxy-D-arabino-heptulosonate 7-phosphate (DAHP) synthase class II
MAEIEGAWPGGIHLEYTGQDVTECLGEPSVAVLEEQPSHRYATPCNLRLNGRQSLDLAFRSPS